MKKLLRWALDRFENWRHSKASPLCDVMIKGGYRVWKRARKENEQVYVCSACMSWAHLQVGDQAKGVI